MWAPAAEAMLPPGPFAVNPVAAGSVSDVAVSDEGLAMWWSRHVLGASLDSRLQSRPDPGRVAAADPTHDDGGGPLRLDPRLARSLVADPGAGLRTLGTWGRQQHPYGRGRAADGLDGTEQFIKTGASA